MHFAYANPQPLKVLTQCSTVVLSKDKQCLMTRLSRAALITKDTFCCQETLCKQKTLQSISLSFVSLCCWEHCLAPPAKKKKKTCVVYHRLGFVPCSKRLREPVGQKHIFSNAALQTICPSVIKVTNLLEVLWLGYRVLGEKKIALCNYSAQNHTTAGRSCPPITLSSQAINKWIGQVDDGV